jgi:hypothetical protein
MDGALCVDGKLWIPSQAKELLQRILIVAHCGIQLHRGEQVMINQLQRNYSIDNVTKIVKGFIRSCLLCRHVKGGKLIQRPWDEPQVVPSETKFFICVMGLPITWVLRSGECGLSPTRVLPPLPNPPTTYSSGHINISYMNTVRSQLHISQ